MYIALAFGSAIFAGLTAILSKIGLKNTDSDVATALRTVVVLIFSWLIVFISGVHTTISTVSTKTIVFLVLSGLATGGSWLCYYKALSLGDATVVVPIDKMSIVLTVIFATLILKEKMKAKEIIGLVVLVAGTLILLI